MPLNCPAKLTEVGLSPTGAAGAATPAPLRENYRRRQWGDECLSREATAERRLQLTPALPSSACSTKNIYAQGAVRVPGHSSACSPPHLQGVQPKNLFAALAPIARRDQKNCANRSSTIRSMPFTSSLSSFVHDSSAPSQPPAPPLILPGQGFVIW